MDVTPEELFYQEFIDPLRGFLNSSPGSITLILPSVRDLVSEQVVYPQSELNRALLRDYGSVGAVPLRPIMPFLKDFR